MSQRQTLPDPNEWGVSFEGIRIPTRLALPDNNDLYREIDSLRAEVRSLKAQNLCMKIALELTDNDLETLREAAVTVLRELAQ